MTLQRTTTVFMAFALAMLMPACAWAAGSAVISADGNQAQIDWADGKLRMDPGNRPGYMIMRGGHVYAIRKMNGQTRVVDLTGMLHMAQQWNKNRASSLAPLDSTIVSLQATGAQASVAGIEGRVYRVKLRDDQGNTQTRQLVLTDDPVVVEMTSTYLHALSAFLGQDRMSHLMQKLPADDRGLLRAGDNYRLQSISAHAPDPGLFVLPGKPSGLADTVQDLLQRYSQ